jgi:cellobiose epimerase
MKLSMQSKKLRLQIGLILVLLSANSLPGAAQYTATETAAPMTCVAPGKEAYLKFADEAETALRRDVLGVWFPRSVDKENGGFRCNFTRDWQPDAGEGKFSVFQGRMVWIASQVVMRRPDLKDQFLPIVRQGLAFLNDVMWDKQQGGFFWGLDDRGKITERYTDGKHLYGIGFCLYGAAAAYQATHEPRALDLAQRAFRWIDEHAHDDKNGGYFEWLTRDGKVVQPQPGTGKVQEIPVAGFPLGYKSMNTHIHLLEAFAQLYEVWKDKTLARRLAELLTVVRDKVCVEPGVMNLYFTTDWQAIPDHDSYGHDVETAYLMLEAESVLGQGHNPKTERMAKMLVDHGLTYGWDETYGGFYREGTTFGKTEDMMKEWWVQVEGLNALLLMHERYGRQTDIYFKAFQQQWQFIRDHQIDSEFRGLYELVKRDGSPTNYAKARMWKAAYHDGRALLNVTERLRKLAADSAK